MMLPPCMSLQPGTRLGHYEIVEPIGAGGMGEVYKAHDSRLHRDVAIKVLAAKTVGDATAEARFEREARSIAAVSHPHICAIQQVLTICDLPKCTNIREVPRTRGGTPRWARDGRGIAYIYAADHRNLGERPLDGSPDHALTHFDDGRIQDYAWSSDGKRLALSRGQTFEDLVLIKGLR